MGGKRGEGLCSNYDVSVGSMDTQRPLLSLSFFFFAVIPKAKVKEESE